MLTRSQFDSACKALIAKYASSTESVVALSPCRGWTWSEHATYPNLGYMSRTVHVFRRAADASTHDPEELIDRFPVEEYDDPNVVPTEAGSDELLTCQQHVVFSVAFRVPAFYFTMCTRSGTPLPLSDIVKTSLFKTGACEGVESSSFALSLPASSFPFLSYGDHPTLGTPCWYFHPCETTAAVEELLGEAEWDGVTRLTRWMEVWFMVVCSIVDL